jgi:hypothetical protein
VAVGVVDDLEVVDVEHREAHVLPEAAASLDLAVERLVKMSKVVQAGELVGDRL